MGPYASTAVKKLYCANCGSSGPVVPPMRFEKGLNIMEVASITGHKDLRMLHRYTHLKAEDLARKLG
jgi:hypothetical protein